MGLIDDGLRKSLEGNFGTRLDNAANAMDALRQELVNHRKTQERTNRLLNQVVKELQKRDG